MTTSTLSTRTVDGVSVPQPGTFTVDAAHTTVGFVARHLMVSKVRGSFGRVSGEITIGEDPLASRVLARIAAASIDTGQSDRDDHLRGPDFLDVERFPELTFASRRVQRRGDDYVVVGDLTIRDVTREVELAVEFEGLARSPWGQEVIGFTATTEIDREDFGITWNQALETGGVLVGKKVRIEISAEAVRQA
jgi:polyisoprenoid-binding protein YceI